MKKFKIIAAVMAAAVTVTMMGCGSTGTGAEQSEAADTAQTAVGEPVEDTTAEETDGQNPVMNYVGAYSDEGGSRYSLLIEATDAVDGVFVTVGHPHDDDYDKWEIYGKIKDNVITYTDAVKVATTPNPEAEMGVDQEEVYTDGTGTFEISQDSKITWKDDKENEGEGLVFVWDKELYEKVQEMVEENADEDAASAAAAAAMNWSGPYVDSSDENLSMEIIASEDADTCEFNITRKGEGSSAVMWTMTGAFDPQTLTVSYENCVKKDVEIDEVGSIVSESVVYEGGTGSFTFNEAEQTVTWKDDKEDAGDGVMFIFNFNANSAEGEGEAGGEVQAMEGEILDEPTEDIPEEEIVDDDDFELPNEEGVVEEVTE